MTSHFRFGPLGGVKKQLGYVGLAGGQKAATRSQVSHRAPAMAARIARRLALAALVLAASTALAVESKSVVLTNANFDEEVLHDTRSAFVLFFAPWCGHCKALKPSWEELAGMYDRSSELLIGQVDCTADNSKALCERYDVEGFPDVKFFEAGNPEPDDYEEDERSVEAFVRRHPVRTHARSYCPGSRDAFATHRLRMRRRPCKTASRPPWSCARTRIRR